MAQAQKGKGKEQRQRNQQKSPPKTRKARGSKWKGQRAKEKAKACTRWHKEALNTNMHASRPEIARICTLFLNHPERASSKSATTFGPFACRFPRHRKRTGEHCNVTLHLLPKAGGKRTHRANGEDNAHYLVRQGGARQKPEDKKSNRKCEAGEGNKKQNEEQKQQNNRGHKHEGHCGNACLHHIWLILRVHKAWKHLEVSSLLVDCLHRVCNGIRMAT